MIDGHKVNAILVAAWFHYLEFGCQTERLLWILKLGAQGLTDYIRRDGRGYSCFAAGCSRQETIAQCSAEPSMIVQSERQGIPLVFRNSTVGKSFLCPLLFKRTLFIGAIRSCCLLKCHLRIRVSEASRVVGPRAWVLGKNDGAYFSPVENGNNGDINSPMQL